MRIERRITFIVGRERVASRQIKRLKMLASMFRSVVIWKNITTAQSMSTEYILKVMSLGCKENDLCQLWIEGSDAELACMVLTGFIGEQFEIVNISHHRKKRLNKSIIDTHLTFQLPFAINYSFEEVKVIDGVDKNTLISKLSGALNKTKYSAIYEGIIDREQISSTAIGHRIAIPHLMFEGIEKPAISVMRLDKEIDWNAKIGSVDFIIAMLIPSPIKPEVAKAFTQITRSLLNPINCDFLTSSFESEAIKAILFNIMARDED